MVAQLFIFLKAICLCLFTMFLSKKQWIDKVILNNWELIQNFLFWVQSNQPHTFVVITLDPPIRKGQTLYPHIVMQVLNI